MADMEDPYFRQKVTEGEAGEWLLNLEQADRNIMVDLGFFGMLAGGDLAQHSTGDLTLDISGPGVGYDQFGQRTKWAAPIRQDMSLDLNASSTTVLTTGNARWLSVFARFKRALTDQRTDGNGTPVFYRLLESYEILVVAGNEAISGSEVKPALRSDAILLSDVHLVFGQTAIHTGDIDTTRRQQILVTPALQGNFLDHVGGIAFRHTGAMIDMAALATWADGSTNPSGTLQAQNAAIVAALRSTADPVGLKKIGARSLAGTTSGPYSISSPVNAEAAVNQLLGALNSHATIGGSAHIAAQITTSLLPAYIGGVNTNPASDVQTQLAKGINDLSGQTTSTGAGIVGAVATTSGLIAAGTVRSQLDAIDQTAGFLGRAATWTQPQTFNGASGDQSPCIRSSVAPTVRKLIAEHNMGPYFYRKYVKIDGTIEETINAAWNGTNWARDTANTVGGPNAVRHTIEVSGTLRVGVVPSATSSPFADSGFTATSYVEAVPAAGKILSLANNGVNSTGPATGYVARGGKQDTNSKFDLASCPWRTRLLSAPSSVTVLTSGKSATVVALPVLATLNGDPINQEGVALQVSVSAGGGSPADYWWNATFQSV